MCGLKVDFKVFTDGFDVYICKYVHSIGCVKEAYVTLIRHKSILCEYSRTNGSAENIKVCCFVWYGGRVCP